VTLADDSCPDPTSSAIDCGADAAWCTSYVSFDVSSGVLTVGGSNAESFPATVDVSLTINDGEPNAATFTISLILVDPCVADATVTLTDPGDWAATLWVTDSDVFAIDPDTDLAHVTDPAGADCGGYTTTFELALDGVAAESPDVDVSANNQITVNFDGDITDIGDYVLTVTSCLTDYSTVCDSFTHNLSVKDACADSATTLAIDSTALEAAWSDTVDIYVAETFLFDTDNWVTVTSTGPTNTPDCGTIAVEFTLTDSLYLTVSPATTATVDFAGDTINLGPYTLTVSVQNSDYVGAGLPTDSYEFSFDAQDPCDDENALSFDSTAIDTLKGLASYDLFDGPDSYSFTAEDMVTPAGATVTESNCGAVVVTIARSSGPDIFVSTGDTTYDLWGSDPADSTGPLTLELTAYLSNYQTESTTTTTFDYSVTNSCAAVTLTAGDVSENDVVTTDVTYENGQEDVTLTYAAFTQDIAYCPLIYTVHLLTADDETEVTWNRESTEATPPTDFTYEAVLDSAFSSNEKSSEYLTITRPADDGSLDGTIVISNTAGLETYVGSYYLELRGTAPATTNEEGDAYPIAIKRIDFTGLCGL